MTRTVLLVLGNLLLVAAARRPSPPLPLPPPLPVDPPTDLAAPVPDESLRGPARPPSEQMAWALRVYEMPQFDTGEAYIPGSAYQSPEERKLVQTPGFMVSVPLR